MHQRGLDVISLGNAITLRRHPGHNSCKNTYKNLQEFSGILAWSGCKVHVRILTELGWPISQNSGANCIMAEKKNWNQTKIILTDSQHSKQPWWYPKITALYYIWRLAITFAPCSFLSYTSLNAKATIKTIIKDIFFWIPGRFVVTLAPTRERWSNKKFHRKSGSPHQNFLTLSVNNQ
jgi:hypothetical protein